MIFLFLAHFGSLLAQECAQWPHSKKFEVAQYHCLPESLPGDWKVNRLFLHYESFDAFGNELAPIFAGNLFVSKHDEILDEEIERQMNKTGKSGPFSALERSEAASILDIAKLWFSDRMQKRYFTDTHYISLPSGAKILEREKKWIYPVGTRLVHVIHWKVGKKTYPFELRVIEQLRQNIWAYGAYVPRKLDKFGNPQLYKLRKDRTEKKGFLDLEKAFETANHVHREGGSRVEKFSLQGRDFTFQRMPTDQCRRCHFTHSLNAAPTKPEEEFFAGPCGFGPESPKLDPWMKEFQSSQGYWPISKN